MLDVGQITTSIERKHFTKASLRRLSESITSDKSSTMPCESCKKDIRDVVITLPCQHSYDIACIEDLFTLSIYGEGRLPRCCEDPIEFDFVATFLEEEVLDGLQEALQELNVREHQEATSSSSNSTAEELPKALDEDILALTWDQGLAQCPGCKMLIEKTEGCSDMTCDCGKEFDYIDCQVPARQPPLLRLSPLPTQTHRLPRTRRFRPVARLILVLRESMRKRM